MGEGKENSLSPPPPPPLYTPATQATVGRMYLPQKYFDSSVFTRKEAIRLEGYFLGQESGIPVNLLTKVYLSQC